MRLRIRRHLTGSVDGVRLDDFRAGTIYDIDAALGSTLLTRGWAERPRDDRSGVPDGGATLVLVVDDEADLRQLTAALLIRHGHYVVEAGNGEEALERLREHAPDLVLLDLNMPVVDGWQFRALQLSIPDERLASIPILLLTGAANAADHAKALNVAGVLRKPVDPEHLLATIAAILPGG